MGRVRLMRYLPMVFLVGLLAVVGFVLFRPKHASAKGKFDTDDVRGRYVSAETAYDVSSVHAFAAPDGSLVGPPVFFAATAVMVADGHGNVCGESDGFYGGTPPPGVNLGPNLFHGTYTVEATTGRITILTASDGPPVPVTNVFCGTTTPINTSGTAVYKTQVGYLQDDDGHTITTSEQINNSDSSQGGCCATTGFLVHARVWTKKARSED